MTINPWSFWTKLGRPFSPLCYKKFVFPIQTLQSLRSTLYFIFLTSFFLNSLQNWFRSLSAHCRFPFEITYICTVCNGQISRKKEKSSAQTDHTYLRLGCHFFLIIFVKTCFFSFRYQRLFQLADYTTGVYGRRVYWWLWHFTGHA